MKPAIAFALLLLAACTRAPAPPAAEPVAPEPVATPAAPTPAPAATPPPDGAVDGHLLSLACAGDAPTWRLDIEADGRGRLREEAGDVELVGELRAARGAFTYRATAEDAPTESFAALVTPGACFPPDNAPAQDFGAQLSFADGRQSSGCCRGEFGLDVLQAGEFAPTDRHDWTRDLVSLADFVERCALDGGVDTRAVTRVVAGDGGKLVVRLRDSDGARFDCLIDRENRDIESIVPLTGAAAVDESRSEWLPADPDALPRLGCGQVFRHSAADGVLRGWVHVRDGC
jgi:hypothetical protein